MRSCGDRRRENWFSPSLRSPRTSSPVVTHLQTTPALPAANPILSLLYAAGQHARTGILERASVVVAAAAAQVNPTARRGRSGEDTQRWPLLCARVYNNIIVVKSF
jgi:hypothetical protein